MKQSKPILRGAWIALALCIAMQSAAFAANTPCGDTVPKNAMEFVPKSIATEIEGNLSYSGSAAVTGYYSGIVFENSNSPYCSGADRAYNTDHSQYVTSVKNQGILNTCWVFGTTAALETAIWKQLGEKVDLSELYTIYATANSSYIDNPYNAYLNKSKEFDANSGGHEGIIMAYWAKGTGGGVVPEEQLEYGSNRNYLPSMTLNDVQKLSENALDYYPSQLILLNENNQYSGNNYSAFTGAKYIQETKDLIKAFGGAAVGYYDAAKGWSYRGTTAIYNHSEYDSGSYDCNHEVLLVGWDDGFDCGSTNLGAFLVKNSYGANPYDGNGFFWMSYDTYFTDVMAVAQVIRASDLYDRIYETDGTVLQNNGGHFDPGDYALMKRTYTTSSSRELLTGAMIYNAYPGTEYKVYYTDSNVLNASTKWTELKVKPSGAISVSSTTGYTKAANTGYLTMQFETPPTVSGHYTLAVVARYAGGSYDIFCTDSGDPLYGTEVSSSLWWSTNEITADTIDSAIRLDANYPVNFTLKAFTKQQYSTVASAEMPCLFGKGAAFSGNTATFNVGAWTKSIPVYTSYTEGSPAKYISASVSGGKLTLTVGQTLRSNLTNYSQRLYLGFRDTNGNEHRVPVTIGKAEAAQTSALLRSGVLYVNSATGENCYVVAPYDNTSGKMTGKIAAAQSDFSIAFDLRARELSNCLLKVLLLDSNWSPKAAQYELLTQANWN